MQAEINMTARAVARSSAGQSVRSIKDAMGVWVGLQRLSFGHSMAMRKGFVRL
jgi:hypothetical protein